MKWGSHQLSGCNMMEDKPMICITASINNSHQIRNRPSWSVKMTSFLSFFHVIIPENFQSNLHIFTFSLHLICQYSTRAYCTLIIPTEKSGICIDDLFQLMWGRWAQCSLFTTWIRFTGGIKHKIEHIRTEEHRHWMLTAWCHKLN